MSGCVRRDHHGGGARRRAEIHFVRMQNENEQPEKQRLETDVYRWRGEGAWQQASWLKVAFLVVRWWECDVVHGRCTC